MDVLADGSPSEGVGLVGVQLAVQVAAGCSRPVLEGSVGVRDGVSVMGVSKATSWWASRLATNRLVSRLVAVGVPVFGGCPSFRVSRLGRVGVRIGASRLERGCAMGVRGMRSWAARVKLRYAAGAREWSGASCWRRGWRPGTGPGGPVRFRFGRLYPKRGRRRSLVIARGGRRVAGIRDAQASSRSL